MKSNAVRAIRLGAMFAAALVIGQARRRTRLPRK